MRQRSPVIIIAGVCIVAMVIVGLVFALMRGQSSSINPGGPGGPLVGVGAEIEAAESGGNLTVTVHNAAYDPFVKVTVSGISPTLSGLTMQSAFIYNGSEISASNPLTIGEESQASYSFTSDVATGVNYTVTVSVTLTDGQVIDGTQVAIIQS
jgi:hypothetical protein